MLFFLFICLTYAQNTFEVFGLSRNLYPLYNYGKCDMLNNCSTLTCFKLSDPSNCIVGVILLPIGRPICQPINDNHNGNFISTIFDQKTFLLSQPLVSTNMNELMVNRCNIIKNNYLRDAIVIMGTCY